MDQTLDSTQCRWTNQGESDCEPAGTTERDRACGTLVTPNRHRKTHRKLLARENLYDELCLFNSHSSDTNEMTKPCLDIEPRGVRIGHVGLLSDPRRVRPTSGPIPRPPNRTDLARTDTNTDQLICAHGESQDNVTLCAHGLHEVDGQTPLD
jgi:hypothetical protein